VRPGDIPDHSNAPAFIVVLLTHPERSVDDRGPGRYLEASSHDCRFGPPNVSTLSGFGPLGERPSKDSSRQAEVRSSAELAAPGVVELLRD